VEYALGVDLGTTHTAAAVRVGDRVQIARLGGRRPEIPSLLYVSADGTILIGESAERRGALEPARLAREVKRRIGDPIPVLVGGSPYSAHALLAHLLQQVVQIITRQQQGPPTAITITHPANWGPYKRELLEQAVRLAELANVTLRVEPEAAVVRYASGQQVRPGEIVAVYDLGGGTFDVAVLRKTDSGFAVLGQPEGIEQLGGVDFDEAVFGHVVSSLGEGVTRLERDDEEAVAALARLRRDCQEAKEALSFDTEVMIPVALPGLHTRLRLNRSEFEAMITPVLMDTLAVMRRAVRSAGIEPEDLSSILLAGGSSRIPMVGQLVAGEFDRPVAVDPDPEHSVALGAALLATAPPGPGGHGSDGHGSGPAARATGRVAGRAAGTARGKAVGKAAGRPVVRPMAKAAVPPTPVPPSVIPPVTPPAATRPANNQPGRPVIPPVGSPAVPPGVGAPGRPTAPPGTPVAGAPLGTPPGRPLAARGRVSDDTSGGRPRPDAESSGASGAIYRGGARVPGTADTHPERGAAARPRGLRRLKVHHWTILGVLLALAVLILLGVQYRSATGP
jgi:actin-like ATPase involved in cell morphogenesis